jgi:hypothetical protein
VSIEPDTLGVTAPAAPSLLREPAGGGASATTVTAAAPAVAAGLVAPLPMALEPGAPAAPEGALQLTFSPGDCALAQVDIAMVADGALSLSLRAQDGARASVSHALDELRRRLLDQGVQVWDLVLAAAEESAP